MLSKNSNKTAVRRHFGDGEILLLYPVGTSTITVLSDVVECQFCYW
jgi:hypothetical protein